MQRIIFRLPSTVNCLLILLIGFSFALQLNGEEKTVTDPLLLVPENAIAIVKIDHPRQIVDKAYQHLQQLGLLQLDEVKEVLQSTPIQRLQRYLSHLEKEYNRPWLQLLDDLTAQGIVLALVPGEKPEKPQFLIIVQTRDPALLQKIYHSTMEVVKNEAEQADEPPKLETKEFHGCTLTSIGPDLHLTQQGNRLLVAGNRDLLQTTITRSDNAKGNSILLHKRFIAAERPQGKDLLAWGWLDLEPIKQRAGKDLDKFKLPTNDVVPQLLFGGLLDAFLRSNHIWLSVDDDGSGPAIRISSTTGREQSQEGSRFLHMHDPKEPGLLPVLHPPGTLYTNSFYWDLGALWTHRDKIYSPGALKELEDGDKKVKPFLAGVSLGQVLTNLGARHRVVVTRQRDRGYAFKPKTPLPSFGVVLECRDAEKFAKTIAIPIRAAGFVASSQVSMKMFEKSHADCKILGYRFDEVEKNQRLANGVLFNFTPCFARLGKYIVFSSTLELCHDLIDELQRQESKTAPADSADARHQFYWSALRETFASERQLLATELTLRHGGSGEKVEQQIDNVLQLLDRLGTIEASVSHSPRFELELRARCR